MHEAIFTAIWFLRTDSLSYLILSLIITIIITIVIAAHLIPSLSVSSTESRSSLSEVKSSSTVSMGLAAHGSSLSTTRSGTERGRTRVEGGQKKWE